MLLNTDFKKLSFFQSIFEPEKNPVTWQVRPSSRKYECTIDQELYTELLMGSSRRTHGRQADAASALTVDHTPVWSVGWVLICLSVAVEPVGG